MPVYSAFLTLDNTEVEDVLPFRDYLAGHNISEEKIRRANSFICPRGREYGRGWVLLTRKALLGLTPEDQVSAPLKSFSHKLKFSWNNRTVEFTELGIVRAEALTSVEFPSDDTLYLVYLADRRYLGPLTAINKAYNSVMDIGTFLVNETKNPSTNAGWEWTELLADIATNIPFLSIDVSEAVFPPVNVVTPSYDRNHRYFGLSAWDVFNSIVDSAHNVVVPKPIRDGENFTFNSSYRVIPYTYSDPDYDNFLTKARQCTVVKLSHDLQEDIAILPEKVRVFYIAHNFQFQDSENTPSDKLHQAHNSLYSETVNTVDLVPDAVTVPGTVKPIHTKLSIGYDSSGSANTPLPNTTEAIANAYLQAVRNGDKHLHNLYHGIHNFIPSNKISAVAYYDIGNGIHTEVIQHPRSVRYSSSPGHFAGEAPFAENMLHHFAQESPANQDFLREHVVTEHVVVVELEEDLVANGSALATPLYGDYVYGTTDPIDWTRSTQSIRVYEGFGVSYSAGDYVQVRYHHQLARWVVTHRSSDTSTFALAVLSADLCDDDPFVDIECVVGICADKPTVACNPLHLSGKLGDVIAIHKVTPCPNTYGYGSEEGCPDLLCDPDGNYTTDEPRWVIVNVQHHRVCPVFAIERRTLEDVGPFLIYAKGTITAMYCDDSLCGHDGGYLCCDGEGGSAGYQATDCMLDFDGTIHDNCCVSSGECCNWPEGGTPEVSVLIESTCSSIDGQAGTLTTTGNRNSGLYEKQPPGDPELILCDGTTEFQIFFQCYDGTDGTIDGAEIPATPDPDLGKAYRYVLYLKSFSATNCCEIISNGPVFPYEASCVTGVFKFHAGTLRVTESCEVAGIPAGPCDCHVEGTCDYGDHDIDITVTQETTGCADAPLSLKVQSVELTPVQPTDSLPRASSQESVKLACHRRGARTRTLSVPGCNSPPAVYACPIHGECVKIQEKHHAGKRKAITDSGLMICRDCPDREPMPLIQIAVRNPDKTPIYPAITRHNLIYHIYAATSDKERTWQANLRQLAHRWKLFNGRKTFAIVQDETTIRHTDIVSYMDRIGITNYSIMVLPNDKILRETATLYSLLAANYSVEPNEATFYAHTKGVSTTGSKLGAEYWRNALYHYLLDDPEKIDALLRTHHTVGGCKSLFPPNTSPYPTRLLYGNWMFAGTYYWFRNDSLYAHEKWRAIPSDRYGAEAYLAGIFDQDDAATVYQPWPIVQYPFPNPYNPSVHKDRLRNDSFRK